MSESPSGMCACGKSNRDCCKWWDKHLGVTGHTADTTGGGESEYKKNLRRIRLAKIRGEDPYHVQLNSSKETVR